MLDALAHFWWFDPEHFPEEGSCHHLLAGTDELNNLGSTAGDEFRVDYLIGGYDPVAGLGPLQVWDVCSPGIGMDVGDEDEPGFGRQLPGVANRAAHAAGDDLDAEVVSNGMIGSAAHFRAIVAGFIEAGIPLAVGVERGGHFNTIVGYWDRGTLF